MLNLKALLLLLTSAEAATRVVTCDPRIPAASCAAAAAGELVVPRAINCKALTGCLGVLKAFGKPATAFCSSYLRIPSATTTITTFTPATRVDIEVITTVITVTEYQNLRRRSFEEEEATQLEPRAAMVRDLEARHILGNLGKFATAEISSACNCLSLTPKLTVTNTITAPTPVITETTVTTSLFTTLIQCHPEGGSCNCDYRECCSGICLCISGSQVANKCL